MLSRGLVKVFSSSGISDALRKKIEEVLENDIRPALKRDGGDIQYLGFDPENGELLIEMSGACTSCPHKGRTLHGTVERYISEVVPEVKFVVDINDLECDMGIDDDLFS